MSKYWVFDRTDTPQGLPLCHLIRKIRQAANLSDCQFLVRRSQGYGSTVCHWDELLDDSDEIAVLPDDLERLTAENDEWFYNLDVRCVTQGGTIAFGVHDSSALFVEAPTEIAQSIIADFKDTRIE